MSRPFGRLRGALVVASLLLASACGAAPADNPGGSAAPHEGGQIDIAWPSQPPTLDPVVVTTSATNAIAYNVFEGLVAMDANLEVKPVLAESYSINADFTQFTFKMRSGVKFQNGTDMTNDDVVASIERWITVSSAGQQFFKAAKITTSGSDVVITLPKTLYTGIYYLAQPLQQLVVMPKASVAKADSKTGVPIDSLIGTGPFKIDSMVVDQEITLSRFAGYTGVTTGTASGITGPKKAFADKLVFHIVKDATTRINGLVSGQYDYATDIPADNAAELKANQDIQLNTLNSGILAVVFDKAQGPFASQKLRQAAQMAVNDEDVLKASYTSPEFYDLNGALAMPAQKDWFTKASLDSYNQHNLEKAKALVKESGYNGEPITFVTTRDYPYMYNSAVVMADTLKKIGLTVNLEVSDWATVLKKIADPKQFDLFVSDFMKRPVPIAYTYLTPTYAGTTKDPDLTAGIDAVNAATSQAQGLKAMEAVQSAHYSYVPAIKFGDIRAITAQRKGVSGFISFISPVFYGSSKS